jgi:hypothetical protein
VNEKNIRWKNFPEAEVRLEELRERDIEISNISKGLQMRARINQLEGEIAQLRSMEGIWLTNRIGRLYFAIPRRFLRLFRRIISGK